MRSPCAIAYSRCTAAGWDCATMLKSALARPQQHFA
jgi:hypothetical protein